MTEAFLVFSVVINIVLMVILVTLKHKLDKLVDDLNWKIRKQITKQRYGLDKLVNDPMWEVRKEVAKKEHKLDVLLKYPHFLDTVDNLKVIDDLKIRKDNIKQKEKN